MDVERSDTEGVKASVMKTKHNNTFLKNRVLAGQSTRRSEKRQIRRENENLDARLSQARTEYDYLKQISKREKDQHKVRQRRLESLNVKSCRKEELQSSLSTTTDPWHKKRLGTQFKEATRTKSHYQSRDDTTPLKQINVKKAFSFNRPTRNHKRALKEIERNNERKELGISIEKGFKIRLHQQGMILNNARKLISVYEVVSKGHLDSSSSYLDIEIYDQSTCETQHLSVDMQTARATLGEHVSLSAEGRKALCKGLLQCLYNFQLNGKSTMILRAKSRANVIGKSRGTTQESSKEPFPQSLWLQVALPVLETKALLEECSVSEYIARNQRPVGLGVGDDIPILWKTMSLVVSNKTPRNITGGEDVERLSNMKGRDIPFTGQKGPAPLLGQQPNTIEVDFTSNSCVQSKLIASHVLPFGCTLRVEVDPYKSYVGVFCDNVECTFALLPLTVCQAGLDVASSGSCTQQTLGLIENDFARLVV